MRILVVGSTGFLGTEICRLALQSGHAVRGLVRATSDPERVEALRVLGAETVEGDLKEPETLAAALEDVQAVISTASATGRRQDGDALETVDHEGQASLVEKAADAGVRHFVLVSLSGGFSLDDPLIRAKRAAEARLRASGMTYTILRPTCFMEAWLSPVLGFDPRGGSVTIYGEGQNPVSWISLLDVARFAVRSLEEEAARNAVLELGGPDALTPLEVVGIFEEETGRPIEVRHVPTAALQARREEASDPMERTFAALMLGVAAGDPIPMEATLRRFPLRLRTVRDHARTPAPAS